MDVSAILISQFLAGLRMLRQVIALCPEDAWNAPSDRNPTWQMAYHAIYFVHEYLADSYEAFVPWEKHRAVYDFDERQVFEPYDQAALLEYLDFVAGQVRERLPRLRLEEPDGHGQEMTTLELQLYSLRHLMQHTGELMERVGRCTGVEMAWVGRGDSA